jgi:hypothetical protein
VSDGTSRSKSSCSSVAAAAAPNPNGRRTREASAFFCARHGHEAWGGGRQVCPSGRMDALGYHYGEKKLNSCSTYIKRQQIGSSASEVKIGHEMSRSITASVS